MEAQLKGQSSVLRLPPSIRLLHRPLMMISPGIFRGASANLKTPYPGPLGISWQQRSHFQNVTWATLYWVPCIQSKLIVIDECEQRRPAQALPNQTQLTLSGRRVFRRYSFLGTPPPQFLIFLCQTDSLNMDLYRRKISSFHSCHVGQVITNSVDSCLSILSW